MKTYNLAYIRKEVERIYPGLPPFILKLDNLLTVSVGLRLIHDDDQLRLLTQQSCLSSALQAWDLGEDMSYLTKFGVS